jgi:pseudaminic acid cytidylyltransferase
VRVAILPARGGSVRVPRKNIRDFMGKPMLQWPIEAAHGSGLFDHIVISTDDQEIADLAPSLGCSYHWREPDDGSMGTQGLAAIVLGSLQEGDQACVIYPCSPMLRAGDLIASHRLLTPRVQWVVSWLEDEDVDAGCLYWGRAWSFLQRNPLTERQAHYPADPARFIDINTFDDWARAESMFNALRRDQP